VDRPRLEDLQRCARAQPEVRGAHRVGEAAGPDDPEGPPDPSSWRPTDPPGDPVRHRRAVPTRPKGDPYDTVGRSLRGRRAIPTTPKGRWIAPRGVCRTPRRATEVPRGDDRPPIVGRSIRPTMASGSTLGRIPIPPAGRSLRPGGCPTTLSAAPVGPPRRPARALVPGVSASQYTDAWCYTSAVGKVSHPLHPPGGEPIRPAEHDRCPDDVAGTATWDGSAARSAVRTHTAARRHRHALLRPHRHGPAVRVARGRRRPPSLRGPAPLARRPALRPHRPALARTPPTAPLVLQHHARRAVFRFVDKPRPLDMLFPGGIPPPRRRSAPGLEAQGERELAMEAPPA
jgi:hypothetical protein